MELNIKVGDLVQLKTLEELSKLYPNGCNMPFYLNDKMRTMLGREYIVEHIYAVHMNTSEYCLHIANWSWPETALVLKTKLGNDLN